MFSFDAIRLVDRLPYHVCVDVNHIFWVSCRQLGSERIRARGVASSFQIQKTVCVSSFCGCGVFFCLGSVLSFSLCSPIARHPTSNVVFTTSSFTLCSSAEQLPGTCMRSRLKKNDTSGFEVLRF